ncbi:sigma-70 family RNA polymerase sigma factor [Catelliglobosispora koreensis]|uniref:sigma-70 family RNA polymerase sigma factor n=1 Tax=Catelliglobosispora koreensis TaxID=129052 RepID=UPI000374BDEC|nr:sigma-70 family RNA polymerase sigma factor [Catelliglobosispora koreensis]
MNLPKQRMRERTTAELRAAIAATVERAQNGDKAAIADLYGRYGDTILRYAYSKTFNEALAEDLASEVWVNALRSLHSYKDQGRDIGAWLITIARNHITDYFKSHRTRKELLAADIREAAGDRADDYHGRQPESALDRLAHAELHEAIRSLNPRQREVIVLRFLCQRSIAETAALMGDKPDSIKALQFRATTALAERLGADHEARKRPRKTVEGDVFAADLAVTP